MFSRLRLLSVLALALLEGGCARPMTFRVVDAETRVALAGIPVERDQMKFDGILYFEDRRFATDAQGIVRIEAVDPFQRITINPPEPPVFSRGTGTRGTGIGGGGANYVHWTNGRREIFIHDLWPQVTYSYADETQRHTAVEAAGIVEIPIPNEAKELEARLDALLSNAAAARTTDNFREVVYRLMQIEGGDHLPLLENIYDRLSRDVLESVAATPAGELADEPPVMFNLFEMAHYWARAGQKQAVLERLRRLYDDCAPRMSPYALPYFKNRLENASHW